MRRGLAIALLVLVGCPRADRGAPSQGGAADGVLSAPVAASERAPAMSASASALDAGPEASPAPSSAASAPPARLGAPGSTKGTIACGASRCRVQGEVCVLAAGAWRCVPAQDESRLPSERSFACDDATDCPDPLNPKNGPTCCVADGFRDERTTCGYRDEVDGDPCTLEVCNGDPGAAACPGGLVCKDEHCRPATPPRATCGKGARCPSEAPVCRWESGAGTCVTTAEAAGLRQDLLDKGPDGRPSVFACTKPSDCGAGQTCCADSAVQVPPGEIALTECRRACGTTVFHNVCETGKDCPAFFSTGAGGGASRQQCAKLAPSGRHPVWAGECHVAGVP